MKKDKKRVKIQITEPVGFSGRVNGVYFTVPATIFVIGDEYIENAEKELKVLKFKYTIEPVNEPEPKTHTHKHHHTTHHKSSSNKSSTENSNAHVTNKSSETKVEKKNEQKDSKDNKDKK